MTAAPQVGTIFAGYRIDALLGRGGMSEVYRAEHPKLGNAVALKILAADLARDELFRERFIRESRMAASLDHPNVIPIMDAGEEDGTPYIAMRYVAGPDLGELLEQGPLSSEHAVSILGQVAGALDAAHDRGLIHRDVKPGNVLIDKYLGQDAAPFVYLSDFGVAKHTLSKSGLTSTGQFVGTIDYVAPEQIEGKPVDRRTDVYSLGCVLYECLSGRKPFDRDSNVAVMYAHLLEPPPTISEVRPDLPRELDGVLATALAKNPEERYASCGQLAAAARQAVGGAAPAIATGEAPAVPVFAAPLTAEVARPLEPAAAPAPVNGTPTAPTVPRPRRHGPSRRVLIIAVAVAAAAGALLMALTQLGSNDSSAKAKAPQAVTTTTPDSGDGSSPSGTKPKRVVRVRVPAFGHLPTAESLTIWHKRGLVVRHSKVHDEAAKGVVLRQTPAAGARVAKGTVVRLIVSSGPLRQSGTTTIPVSTPAHTTTAAPEPTTTDRRREPPPSTTTTSRHREPPTTTQPSRRR